MASQSCSVIPIPFLRRTAHREEGLGRAWARGFCTALQLIFASQWPWTCWEKKCEVWSIYLISIKIWWCGVQLSFLIFLILKVSWKCSLNDSMIFESYKIRQYLPIDPAVKRAWHEFTCLSHPKPSKRSHQISWFNELAAVFFMDLMDSTYIQSASDYEPPTTTQKP